jgi:phosphoserine aminotransferase
MNLVQKGATAEYVVTGAWGEKAVSEAKAATAMLGGSMRVAATTGTGEGKEKSYVRVPRPDEVKTDPSAAYVHLTSNETIHGVQYEVDPARPFPTTQAPLVADMSSDFLWRPFDVSRFGLVYAGAQKNIGPSGVVVVIAAKALIDAGRKDIPKIFQLRTPAENKSLYNTPPTFGIYMIRNVLAWLKGLGGLPAIEARNRKKAARLYGAIDASPSFYRCPVERESRSVMNVVFRLPSEPDEERFVSEAKKLGMVGLKGHRSVGGIRVSTYNAVEPAWVDELADFMAGFAKRG